MTESREYTKLSLGTTKAGIKYKTLKAWVEKTEGDISMESPKLNIRRLEQSSWSDARGVMSTTMERQVEKRQLNAGAVAGQTSK